MIDKDQTLTVADLLAAVADGRVRPEMPLAVNVRRGGRLDCVLAFELHGGAFVLQAGEPAGDADPEATEIFP